MAALRRAAGAALAFRRTPSGIAAAAARLIAREKLVHDQVAAEPRPTFASTIARLARLENESGAEAATLGFLQNVDADKRVRDASSEAERALLSARMASQMREDVHRSVRRVLDDPGALAALDPEDRALADRMARQYRRSGLDLPAGQRAELERIRARLIAIGVEFSRNINEGDGAALFARAELDGLPASFFSGRATAAAEDGTEQYVVTTKYPDLVPLMQLARREATRRRMHAVAEARCPQNIPLLREAVALRQDAARLLGYRTHAEFALEENMARAPAAVLRFEADLRARLAPQAERELRELEALKRADKAAAGEPYAGLFAWDHRYYANLAKERRHSVCDEDVRQYLPAPAVTRGVLDVCQDMLGLRLARVERPDAWHPDVEMYEVRDADGGALVGHFYLDLYPRPGKYNHACVVSLRPGYEREDGSRECPAVAMLANFPRPTADAPALLTHDDVVTLLHELGHVFHALCARTRWARFGLDGVQMDFVEAPSQLLENWAWDPAVLRRVAVHHRTGAPIPADLVARLVAARNEGAGLFHLRQLFFGRFDMAVHSAPDARALDIPALYRALREQVARIPAGPASAAAGSCGAATFGHILGGYDAQYYVYLWAKVFSADMYATRFRRPDPRAGRDLRREILEPGGARDAAAGLAAFLGREPDPAALLALIGCDAGPRHVTADGET
ncbi:metalloendopeptidase [Coemansia javaensis]|uniref:Metalloendopeptidase n=1 Tax=Coemansia javaensis TaxID=2761396 RepID=A0A9W8LI16_9FUNG|nr:metalloendopeptidase [Coemansia javaensis]